MPNYDIFLANSNLSGGSGGVGNWSMGFFSTDTPDLVGGVPFDPNYELYRIAYFGAYDPLGIDFPAVVDYSYGGQTGKKLTISIPPGIAVHGADKYLGITMFRGSNPPFSDITLVTSYALPFTAARDDFYTVTAKTPAITDDPFLGNPPLGAGIIIGYGAGGAAGYTSGKSALLGRRIVSLVWDWGDGKIEVQAIDDQTVPTTLTHEYDKDTLAAQRWTVTIRRYCIDNFGLRSYLATNSVTFLPYVTERRMRGITDMNDTAYVPASSGVVSNDGTAIRRYAGNATSTAHSFVTGAKEVHLMRHEGEGSFYMGALSGEAYRLSKSDDEGKTWQTLSTALPPGHKALNWCELWPCGFAVLSSSAKKVWVSTSWDGVSWTDPLELYDWGDRGQYVQIDGGKAISDTEPRGFVLQPHKSGETRLIASDFKNYYLESDDHFATPGTASAPPAVFGADTKIVAATTIAGGGLFLIASNDSGLMGAVSMDGENWSSPRIIAQGGSFSTSAVWATQLTEGGESALFWSDGGNYGLKSDDFLGTGGKVF